MSEHIAYLYSLGGLVSNTSLSALRGDTPKAPAKMLAEPASFQLPGHDAPSRRQLEEDIELTYRTTEAAWNVFAQQLDELDVTRLRERLLLPLLRDLGFDPQYQSAHLVGDDRKRYAITHLGWDGDDAPPMVLTNVDLDHRESRARSPHQELQAYLNESPALWGIVANGHEIRILRDFHHTTTQGAIVVTLADLIEAGSFEDFRALYRLAHATRFTESTETGDSEPSTLLEQLYLSSLSEGVQVGKALQPQVRTALVTLLNGFLEGDPALRQRLSAEPEFGRQLYGELLTVLYRIMFLLFAEQRGLLSSANDMYHQSYSATRLRDLAETRSPEPRRKDLWEGLKATFRAFSGDETFAVALNVHPYNGRLFDPGRTPNLNSATATNRQVLDAFRALTTVELDRVRQYVDYRHVGVEELGSVYESLLNYTIRLATGPVTVDGAAFGAGQAYLAALSIERSELGAYYTPPRLVDLTLSKALDDLIDQRVTDHRGDADAQERALLDLRIIDPACGSAAFLVGAIDRVAAAVADVRTGERAPSDRDIQRARRDVLQHCIYGVDLDPFAVELAKVALWIHCAVDDLPLNFLDHKIVQGDSLVGWPLFDIPDEIPSDAYAPPSGVKGDAAQPYRTFRDRNAAYLSQFAEHRNVESGRSGTDALDLETLPLPDVNIDFPAALHEDDLTVDDVRLKNDTYLRYLNSNDYRRLRDAADIWTAAFFWTPDHGAFPTSRHYHDALAGSPDATIAETARTVLADVTPLHWPINFPDIHHRGGFDLVIGNPPWEQFENREEEFFAAAGRFDISEMTSAARKEAIAGLAEGRESERLLHDHWIRYSSANLRMADWVRECGRYVRGSGKVNTYIVFSDLSASISPEGWVSVVVKSGIAIDEGPSALWRRLLDSGRVRSVTDIVNHGQATFPAVAAVERFAIFNLGPQSETESIALSMLSFSLDEAAVKEPIWLTRDDMAVANPFTRTLLSAPTKFQYDLSVDIHRRMDVLDLDGRNPWNITYRQLFNAANASGSFLKKSALEEGGWQLGRDKIFRRGDAAALPVLEGQLVGMYDHRVKSYETYAGPNKYGRKPNVPWTTDEDKSDPLFESEPRYWMDAEQAQSRIREVAPEGTALVAIRDIARPWTDQRTGRAAIVARLPATHKLPIFIMDLERAVEYLALHNSTAFDFIARNHQTNPNFAMKWILSQLAVPAPGLDARISAISERLTFTSKRLSDEYNRAVQPWDAVQRDRDRVMLDALVAKIAYELTVDEYETVLDSFDVMRRAQIREHGEYRFKRLCLEAYDQI